MNSKDTTEYLLELLRDAFLYQSDTNYIERLDAFISEQPDPLHMMAHCVDWIAENQYAKADLRLRIVQHFISQNFNPLLCKATIQQHDEKSSAAILDHLIARENQGDCMRTPDGGNIFHHLAPTSFWNLITLLKIPGDPIEIWANAVQHDGKTPLHIVWDHINQKLPSEAWGLTHSFLQRGANLLVSSHSGTTVLSQIEIILKENEDFQEDAIPAPVLSEIDAARLQSLSSHPKVASIGRRI